MRNPLLTGITFPRYLLCCGLLSATLHPTHGTLNTNLTPVADTALRDGASADVSFGIAPALPVGVGGSGSPINHALLKFPIEFIPTNATVTAVALRLNSIAANPFTPGTANFSTYRMLKPWNETETTWNTRLAPAIGWGVPGAQANVDYVSAASASAPITPGPSVNFFNSAEMLNDVALWRTDPGTNFGWILIADNELAGSGKQIASREDTVQPPLLIVTYTLPAPPATAPIIINPALVNGSFQFSFNATSNHAHVVEASSSLSPTNWITLTNIAAFPADTLLHITNAATGNEHYFRVGAQ
ncbi:MAG: DNRLRE domain-containing protein [Verrucomicrobiota bacterium]